MIPVLVVVAIVAVIAIVILVRRREPDTLDSFRRQIDALSPEARRPVVDQVQRIDDPDELSTDELSADERPSTARPDGDPPEPGEPETGEGTSDGT